MLDHHQDTAQAKKVKVFVVGALKKVGQPYAKVKMQASVFKTATVGDDETAWDYCAAASVSNVTSRRAGGCASDFCGLVQHRR